MEYLPPELRLHRAAKVELLDGRSSLEHQALLSHDIATKHRLHAYGGLGYDHLITNVVPRLRRRGLSDADVETLIVDNPARLFSFVEPD